MKIENCERISLWVVRWNSTMQFFTWSGIPKSNKEGDLNIQWSNENGNENCFGVPSSEERSRTHSVVPQSTMVDYHGVLVIFTLRLEWRKFWYHLPALRCHLATFFHAYLNHVPAYPFDDDRRRATKHKVGVSRRLSKAKNRLKERWNVSLRLDWLSQSQTRRGISFISSMVNTKAAVDLLHDFNCH